MPDSHVEGYTRRTKSGKVVQVGGYDRNAEVRAAEAKIGRVPIAARPGSFANGRSVPGTPAIAKAQAAEREAKIKEAKAQNAAARKMKTGPVSQKEPAAPPRKMKTGPIGQGLRHVGDGWYGVDDSADQKKAPSTRDSRVSAASEKVDKALSSRKH